MPDSNIYVRVRAPFGKIDPGVKVIQVPCMTARATLRMTKLPRVTGEKKGDDDGRTRRHDD